MRRPNRCREGFTLIELSMVLVVIGLIVGGILVGQDLIRAAETRAQISQIQKYNAAVNTFVTKYGGLPGDLALTQVNQFGFTVINCLGDGSYPSGGRNGDGIIQGAGINSPLAAYMGENELFWLDLSASGLINFNVKDNRGGICIGSITAPSTSVGLYVPAGIIGGNNFLQVYGYGGNNWFMLSGVSSFSAPGGSTANGVPALSVIQAYNLDKKIDDGLPTTGSVVAVYVTNSQQNTTAAPNGNPDTASTCYNNSTNTYSTNISNGSNVNCALSFKFP